MSKRLSAVAAGLGLAGLASPAERVLSTRPVVKAAAAAAAALTKHGQQFHLHRHPGAMLPLQHRADAPWMWEQLSPEDRADLEEEGLLQDLFNRRIGPNEFDLRRARVREQLNRYQTAAARLAEERRARWQQQQAELAKLRQRAEQGGFGGPGVPPMQRRAIIDQFGRVRPVWVDAQGRPRFRVEGPFRDRHGRPMEDPWGRDRRRQAGDPRRQDQEQPRQPSPEDVKAFNEARQQYETFVQRLQRLQGSHAGLQSQLRDTTAQLERLPLSPEVRAALETQNPQAIRPALIQAQLTQQLRSDAGHLTRQALEQAIGAALPMTNARALGGFSRDVAEAAVRALLSGADAIPVRSLTDMEIRAGTVFDRNGNQRELSEAELQSRMRLEPVTPEERSAILENLRPQWGDAIRHIEDLVQRRRELTQALHETGTALEQFAQHRPMSSNPYEARLHQLHSAMWQAQEELNRLQQQQSPYLRGTYLSPAMMELQDRVTERRRQLEQFLANPYAAIGASAPAAQPSAPSHLLVQQGVPSHLHPPAWAPSATVPPPQTLGHARSLVHDLAPARSQQVPQAAPPQSVLGAARGLPSQALGPARSSSLPPAPPREEAQPQAVQPQAATPQAVPPQAAPPQAVQPQAVQPQAAAPQAVPPQAAPPQAAPPQAAPPQAVQPQAATPQAVPPQSAPPRPAQPQSAPPRPAQPQSAPPRPAQPQSAPPQPAQPQSAPPQPAQPVHVPWVRLGSSQVPLYWPGPRMPKQSLSVQSSVWSGPLNWERWLMTQPAIRGPGAAGLGAGIAKKAASTALASSALQQLDQQLRERYDAMRQALLSRALADGLPAPLVDQWMGSLNRAFASRRDQLHYLANRYGLPEASSGPPGAAASAAPTSAMVSAAGQLRSVLRQLRQGQASYERAMASLQESAGGGTGERIREVRAALASLRAQKAELDSSLAGMKSLSELANIQYDPEILDSMLGISDPYARTGNWLAKFFSNVADIWGGSEAKNRRRAALYQEHRSQARAAEMRKQLQEQETLLMSELQDLEARAAQLTQTQRAALTRQWEQSKSKLEARRAELLAAHPELEELARLDEAHASAVEGLRENPFDPELQREVQQLTQALSKFTAPSTTLAAASPGSSGGQQGVSLPELLVASPLSLASGHGFDRSAHGWDDRNFRRGGSRYWIVYDDQPRGWKRRYREMAREERGADPETLQRHQEELKMRGGARRPSAAPVAASETPPGPWAAEDLEPEQLPVAPTPMPAVEPAKLDLGPGSGGLGPLHKASLHRSLILPGLAAAAVLSAGRRQQPAAPAPSAQIIPLPPATGDDLSRLEVLATMAAARSASRKRRRRRPSRSDTAARPRDPSEESTDLQADLQADL